MPNAGGVTKDEAIKRGYVPAGPIARVVKLHCLETGRTPTGMEEILGIGSGLLLKACNGTKDWMEFDTADRVITHIDPFLWRSDPELAEIYQGYDFSYLDLRLPPSQEVDELDLLDGIGTRHAASVLGVSQVFVQRERRNRAAA